MAEESVFHEGGWHTAEEVEKMKAAKEQESKKEKKQSKKEE